MGYSTAWGNIARCPESRSVFSSPGLSRWEGFISFLPLLWDVLQEVRSSNPRASFCANFRFWYWPAELPFHFIDLISWTHLVRELQ